MRTKTNLILIFCTLFSATALGQDSESIVVVAQKDLSGYWAPAKEERPHYPRMAFNSGKQGCAVIGFIIDSDGSTSNHRVLFSYPDAAFNRAAINAYKKWHFEPASQNQKKEAVFTAMTATFTWVDKEEDRPDVRNKIDSLCKQEGDNALLNLVQSRPE